MRHHSMYCAALLFYCAFIMSGCAVSTCSRRKMAPYNRETYMTVKGSITSIDTVFNKKKKEDGLHLTVQSDSGEYVIHVCPQWYADKEHLKFKIGELLTVSGSKFIKDNKPNIYAASITCDTKESLHLRNPKTGDGIWDGRFYE
ncbi:MAG: hypothetical protein ACMUIP_15200 [bacterium]